MVLMCTRDQEGELLDEVRARMLALDPDDNPVLSRVPSHEGETTSATTEASSHVSSQQTHVSLRFSSVRFRCSCSEASMTILCIRDQSSELHGELRPVLGSSYSSPKTIWCCRERPHLKAKTTNVVTEALSHASIVNKLRWPY